MKKHVLFPVIAMLLSLQMDAQVYHPFPDSDATWKEEALWTFSWLSETIRKYCGIKVSLGSDTIINSKIYTLVQYKDLWWYETADGIATSSIGNNPSNNPETIIGAIREDSDKKVWLIYFSQYIPFCTYVWTDLWPWPIDSEMLLYDFDLHIGSVVGMGAGTRLVAAIDSTQLQDGSFRKEFIMSTQGGNPPERWIEGIGSTLGFFGPYIDQIIPLTSGGSWLNCFSENGQTLFQKSNLGIGVTCDSLDIHLILEVPSEGSETPIALLNLPNPFNTFTTIQFNLTTTSKTSLDVFDMNGRMIKSLLNNEMLSAGSHYVNFDAENFLSGVYYYILWNDTQVEAGKMILLR